MSPKENQKKFVDDIWELAGEYGSYSGWIHHIEKKDDDTFEVGVEPCHAVDPIKQVKREEVSPIGYELNGNPYEGFIYKLTYENLYWGLYKWVAWKKYDNEVQDRQVRNMILKSRVDGRMLIDLPNMDYDADDAFAILELAMFGGRHFS